MEDIKELILKTRQEIEEALKKSKGQTVQVVAVSKKQPLEKIKTALSQGFEIFGESYVQELLSKKEAIANKNIKWHFIGRLQTNKIKKLVGEIEYIHSLSDLKSAEEISQRALEKEISQRILIQINIGEEKTKNGLLKEEGPSFLEKLQEFSHLKFQVLCVSLLIMKIRKM